MGIDNAMAHKHALKERKDDLYETPEVATRALLANESIPACVWEPACGKGAISRIFEESGRRVVSTDLVHYGYGRGGIDFLMESAAPAGTMAIVTNPPFKLASEFAAHAIRLAPKVAMLLRLAFLESGDETGKRHCQRERAFALDGGNLARVLIFRNRLPMMHRASWEGPRTSSGTAFAWFVWEKGHEGPPVLRRISWEAAE